MRRVGTVVFILTGSLFLCSTFARGQEKEINLWSEYGQRSTAELIEEEDLDLDYRYFKTNFYFRQNLSKRFGYKLGYRIYDKDYEIDESRDNRLQSFLSSWDWNWLKKPINLKWRLKADYKQRRYEHKPQNEYDQASGSLKLTLEKKDSWQASFKGSVKDYDYLESKDKDELQHYFQIAGKKYFLGKFLTVRGNYKFQSCQRSVKSDKEDDVMKGGFDLRPDLEFIRLIRFNIEKGSGGTVGIEERDDAYDYNYRRWYLLNRFKLTKRINSSLRWEDLKKDYLIFNHDYTGFLLENNWRFDLIKDKLKTISLNLGLGRKKMDYPDASALTFKRSRGSVGLAFRQKRNWFIKCGVDLTRYNFLNKKDKNKVLYAGVIELEKKFHEQALSLNLRLRYVLKDYSKQADVEQNSCRAGLNYKF